MIERDWSSYPTALLGHHDFDVIQNHIRSDLDEMPEALRAAMLPLAYMRLDQMVVPKSGESAGEHYEQATQALLHWLSIVQFNIEQEPRLQRLGESLTREMMHTNSPKPGEKLSDEWRDFLQQMLEQPGQSNVERIVMLGHHYVLALPYRISLVLQRVRDTGNEKLQELFIRDALDAPPYYDYSSK